MPKISLVEISADKVTNGNNEFEINYGWPSLEFGDGDNSFEQILRKIEVTHLQVHKLKTQIDKVISENPGKFSSMNQLSLLVPCDVLTSSDQNPVSPPENGHSWPSRSLCAASQHVSECNMGDVLMPESAVLSHGEVTPLPNLMDSMPPFGGLCTNVSISFVMIYSSVLFLWFRNIGNDYDHVHLCFCLTLVAYYR